MDSSFRACGQGSPRELAEATEIASLQLPGTSAHLVPKFMQLERRHERSCGHGLTQVLLDHLLSDTQADEGEGG